MQAMVLDAPADIADEPLALRDVPRPQPGPRDVLLRVSVCGVCRTDLHTVEADFPLPRTPLVPGHQVVGVVEAVGEKVTERAEGDRVGVAWLHSTCGRCRFCTSGRENLCPDARFTGLHADGGYAEFMTVPAATREDGRAMMRLAAEAGVETEVRTFPLAEANRVLQMVKDSEIRGAAVLRVG